MMKMIKRHKLVVSALALAVFFSGATALAAGDFSMMGHRRHMKSGLMRMKTFLKLNLTDTQRSRMLAIIDRYQGEGKKTRERLKAARQHLMETAHAEKFNEAEARRAFQQVSAVREDLFISKMMMRAEMKGVLTPQQAALLEQEAPRCQGKGAPHSGRGMQHHGR